MSTTVDNRVVQMQFDNAQFESGIAQSLATLEKLDKALDDLDSQGGFSGLSRTVSDLGDEIDNAFSFKGVMALETFRNVASEVFTFLKSGLQGIIHNYLPVDLIGQAMTGGQRRAQNIEQAKFQLEGLGTSWEALAEDINFAVDQTAYGLDAAGKAASQLVASGVQYGKTFGETGNSPMAKALRGISGVAAMTNSSYDEIAHIFTTIGGNGKMMTKELRMMAYRGLNVAATMAEQFNKVLSGDTETMAKYSDQVIDLIKDMNDGQLISEQFLRDNMKDGIVTSEMFFEAMNAAYGEHATKANETYAGSLDNVKAALSRLGAVYYQGHMDNMIPFFNQLRIAINGVKEVLTPVIEQFVKFEQFGLGVINNLLTDEITTGEKAGQRGPGVIVRVIGNFVDQFTKVLDQLKLAFSSVFTGLTAENVFKVIYGILDFISRIHLSESTLQNLLSIFHGIFSAIDLAKDTIVSFGQTVWYVIEPVISVFGRLLNILVGGLLYAFGEIGNAISGFRESLSENQDLIDFIEKCRDFTELVATKLTGALIFITALLLTLWETLTTVASGVANLAGALLTVLGGALASVGTFLMALLPGIALTLATAIAALVTGFMSLIDWIGSLWASLQSFSWEEFRKGIDDSVAALSAWFDGIIASAPAYLQEFLQSIKSFGGEIIRNVLDFVDKVAAIVQDFFRIFQEEGASKAFEYLGTKIRDFGSGVIEDITGIFDSIVDTLSAAYEAITGWADSIWSGLTDGFSGFFNFSESTTDSATNFLEGFLNGLLNNPIISTIADFLNWVGEFFIGVFNFALGEHSPSVKTEESGVNFFQGFINGLKKALAFVLAVIATMGLLIIGAFKAVIEGAVSLGSGAYEKVSYYIGRIQQAFDEEGIAGVYKLFEGKLVRTGQAIQKYFEAITPVVISSVSSAFQTAGDAIGKFFESIADTRLGRAMTTVQNKFTQFGESVSKFFQNFAGGVFYNAFNQIKDFFNEFKLAFAEQGFSGVINLAKQKFEEFGKTVKDFFSTESIIKHVDALVLKFEEFKTKATTTFDTIWNTAKTVFDYIKEKLDNVRLALVNFFDVLANTKAGTFIGYLASQFKEFFEVLGNSDVEFDRSVLGPLGKFADGINHVVDRIKNIIKGVDALLGDEEFAAKIEAALGLTTLIAIPQVIIGIFAALAAAKKSLDKAVGIVKAIGSLASSVKSIAIGMAAALRIFAFLGGLQKILIGFAVFMVAFGYTMKTIADIKSENFEAARQIMRESLISVGAIILLAGGLATLMQFFSRKNAKVLLRSESGLESFLQTFAMFAGVALAVYGLAKALKVIQDMKIEELNEIFTALGTVLFLMLGLGLSVGLMSAIAPRLSTGFLTILTFAAAVFMLIKAITEYAITIAAFNAADKMDAMEQAYSGVLAILAMLALVAAACRGARLGGGIALLIAAQLILNIDELLGAIMDSKNLKRLTLENIKEHLETVVIVLAALGAVVLACNKAGKHAFGLGIAIAAIISSIGGLLVICTILAHFMKDVSLDQVVNVIAILAVVFMGIMGIVVLSAFAGKLAFGTIASIAVLLVVVGMMTTVFTALAALNPDALSAAMTTVFALEVGIAAIVAALGLASGWDIFPLIGVVAIIGTLAYSLYQLKDITFDWHELNAIYGMGAILLELIVILGITTSVAKEGVGSVLATIAILAEVDGLIALLWLLSDKLSQINADEFRKNIWSIVGVMAAIAALVFLAQTPVGMGGIAIIALGIYGIAKALTELTKAVGPLVDSLTDLIDAYTELQKVKAELFGGGGGTGSSDSKQGFGFWDGKFLPDTAFTSGVKNTLGLLDKAREAIDKHLVETGHQTMGAFTQGVVESLDDYNVSTGHQIIESMVEDMRDEVNENESLYIDAITGATTKEAAVKAAAERGAEIGKAEADARQEALTESQLDDIDAISGATRVDAFESKAVEEARDYAVQFNETVQETMSENDAFTFNVDFTEQGAQAGAEYADGFVQAIEDRSTDAVLRKMYADQEAASKATEATPGGDISGAAENTLLGYLNELFTSNIPGQISAQMEALGSGWIDSLGMGLGVQSPSWKTALLAMYTMLGYTGYIDENGNIVIDKMGELGNSIINSFGESLDSMVPYESAANLLNNFGLGIEEGAVTLEDRSSDAVLRAMYATQDAMRKGGEDAEVEAESIFSQIGGTITETLNGWGIDFQGAGLQAGSLTILGLIAGVGDPAQLQALYSLAEEVGDGTIQSLLLALANGEITLEEACATLGVEMTSSLGVALNAGMDMVQNQFGQRLLGLANMARSVTGALGLAASEGESTFTNFYEELKKKIEEASAAIPTGGGGGGGGGGKSSGGSGKSAKDAEEAAKRHAKAVEYENKVIEEFVKVYGSAYEMLGETAAVDAAKAAIHEMAVEYAKAGDDIEVTEEDIEKAFIEMYDNVHKAIDGSIDMFQKFKVESAGSTRDFILNMKSNLDATEEWSNGLERLAARGFSKGLVEELANAGVKSLDKVRMLLKSTYAEMTEANALWDAKKEAEANAAIKALTAMAYAGQTSKAVLAIATGDIVEQITGISQELIGASEELAKGEAFMAEATASGYQVYADGVDDVFRSMFGNIDVNTRQVLTWTEDKISEFSGTIVDWVDDVAALPGTVSTVLGTSKEYDGVDIAFSPMLQTEDGPQVLSEATVDKYIYGLIEEAGEGWSSEDLLRLDAEGLEIDGKKINKLIADIGETATTTGEAMHYLGDTGSIAKSYQIIQEAADKAGVSYEDYVKQIQEASNATNKLTSVSKEMAAEVSARIDAINVRYKELRESVADTIRDQMDLFSEFDRKTETTAEQMLKNMESQLLGASDWANGLVELQARGLDQGLIDQLVQLGPKGYDQMNAFLQMTEDQLGQANEYYETSLTLPDTLAAQVSDGYLNVATTGLAKFIEGLQVNQPEVDAAAAEVINGATEQMKITVLQEGLLDEVGKQMNTRLGYVIVNSADLAKAGGEKVANEVINTESTTFENNSESAGINGNVAIRDSLIAHTDIAAEGGAEMGYAVLNAFYEAVGQASPWKTMLESGKYANEGLAQGLTNYSNLAVTAAEETGTSVTDSLGSAIDDFSTIFTDDVDLDPSIRPTLDLTDVERKSSMLSSMFGSRSIEMAGKVQNVQSQSSKLLNTLSRMKPGNTTNMGGFNTTINAAPGQDPEEIGRAVSRQIYRQMLSREVNFA